MHSQQTNKGDSSVRDNSLQRWLATPSRALTIVLGTRAQTIKMAPVLKCLEQRGHPYHLVLTGQHTLTISEILADFDIEVQPIKLFRNTEISGIGAMLLWLPRVIIRLIRARDRVLRDDLGRPTMIMVHGDTVSTIAGAIAGRLTGCPVAHVEAGLRSFKLSDPFPEELTRILVSRLTQLHYAPGPWAASNIKNKRGVVVDTGENTLLDSLYHAFEKKSRIPTPLPEKPYCVVSIHRFENIFSRKRMSWLAKSLAWMSNRINVEFILHPATDKRLIHYGLRPSIKSLPGIRLRERMSYIPFVQILKGANFVITDGGSNQEELHYLGKPTLLLRETTERQEGIGALAILCNFNTEMLQSFVDNSLARNNDCAALSDIQSPSMFIADHVRNFESNQ